MGSFAPVDEFLFQMANAVSANYKSYMVVWICFCVIAIGIFLIDRKQLKKEWPGYVRFLCVPWKLAIFIPAFLFVTFAGHFTDDETWDVVTGAGMSILTFTTAPWATGVFYQALKRRRPVRYLVVALALCLFSSSWFYDGYLLLRDGTYTTRWLGNLMLSPIIYTAAGLLWNLEVTAKDKITLSFLKKNWPESPVRTDFRPILFVAVPLILIAAFTLIAFVGWHF